LPSTDLEQAGAVARKVFVIILAVSVTEILVALSSRSVALLADGVHSLATGIIFLILWIGLRLSGRSPDGTFHFGYFRIEALGSLVAAFLMAIFGGLILFEAYSAWMEQRAIANPALAVIVATIAAVIAVFVTVSTERSAKKHGYMSLRTATLNGSIDVLSSLAVVVGVITSSYLGILHADSIAAVLVALTIFWGAYSIFKESSLVLVDACNCGDIVNVIGDIARNVKGVKEVHSIRVRKLGPYIVGDMHIVVDSNMIVKEADIIATQVEETVKKEIGNLIEIKIRIESTETHDTHSQEFTIRKS
jgi:cation diffusion facilitator family transporter